MTWNIIAIMLFGGTLYAYMRRDPEIDHILAEMEDPNLAGTVDPDAIARNAGRAIQIAHLIATENTESAQLLLHVISLADDITQQANSLIRQETEQRPASNIITNYLELRETLVLLARVSAPGIVDKFATSFYI